MPFTGYDFEGFCFFGLCLFLGLAYRSGIDIVCQLFSGFIPSLSGTGKADCRICPQGKEFFFSLIAIF